MAGSKISNYGSTTTDWTAILNTLDADRMAKIDAVSLSYVSTTTKPTIEAASVCEIAGSVYRFSTEEPISTTSVTSTSATNWYVELVPSSSTVTARFSTVTPAWRTDYQGYYNSTTSNYRTIGRIYFTGTTYVDKLLLAKKGGIYVNDGDLAVDERVFIGSGINNLSNALVVQSTTYTTQFRLGYDSNSYITMSVADGGNFTIASGESTGDIRIDPGDSNNYLYILGGATIAVASSDALGYGTLQHNSTDFRIGTTGTSGGDVIIINTTDSTSKDTGALIVEGGVGIEKTCYVGGGVYCSSNAVVTGTLTIDSATNSTSKDTGALIVSAGGLGVEANTYIGGDLSVSWGGSLTPAGGWLIDGTVYHKGYAIISGWNMDTSTSKTVDLGFTVASVVQVSNISIMIRNDADTIYYPFGIVDTSYYSLAYGSTLMTLQRVTGSVFDSTSYASTTSSRGIVYFNYST